jgi:hypothetical protein
LTKMDEFVPKFGGLLEQQESACAEGRDVMSSMTKYGKYILLYVTHDVTPLHARALLPFQEASKCRDKYIHFFPKYDLRLKINISIGETAPLTSTYVSCMFLTIFLPASFHRYPATGGGRAVVASDLAS